MKQYQTLIKFLIDKYDRLKSLSKDRTGVGTVKTFGWMMRFNLEQGFPLVTVKKTFFNSIIRELLWFLMGSTDNKKLQEMGCHIWDPWAVTEKDLVEYYSTRYNDPRLQQILSSSDEYSVVLDGLIDAGIAPADCRKHIDQLGPIYSDTWTNWQDIRIIPVDSEIPYGFEDMGFDDRAVGDTEARVIGRSINQIQNVIDMLKTNPHSRRIIVSAWDPRHLPDESISPQANVIEGRAALAYCHAFFQFATEEMSFLERAKHYMGSVELATDTVIDENYLDEVDYPKYRLNCMLMQRSTDSALGLPFNIASYSLLTMMIAQCVNMVPGDFVWTGGDVHLYANQVEPMRATLELQPFESPTVKLNPAVKDIFAFKEEDITLLNYKYHPPIKMDAAV